MALVYLHKKKTNGEIFYVGITIHDDGNRPFDMIRRSELHKRVQNKYGCVVEILHFGITEEQAQQIEINLIEKYGRKCNGSGTLTNISIGGEHFTTGVPPWNKGLKSDILRGEEYRINAAKAQLGKKFTEEHKKRISIATSLSNKRRKEAKSMGITYAQYKHQGFKYV